MLGGALASLGMVASSFCHTLSQLYLTAGFITGDCIPISRISGCLLKSARRKCRQCALSSGAASSHTREKDNEQINKEGLLLIMTST